VAEKAFNPSRGALHRSLIASVLNYHPEAKTHGFRKALEGCGSYMRELFRYEPEWWSGIALVPDAYMIDHERGAVIVFEAVHTHPLPPHQGPLKCRKRERLLAMIRAMAEPPSQRINRMEDKGQGVGPHP
jgi:hypothetical protein